MWRNVKGYENLYEVSDDGRIRNSKTKRHLKPYGYNELSKGGSGNRYYKVKLYSNGGKTSKTFVVHRIVATAYCGNDNNMPEVNHIDGNRANNKASNLEWVSRTDNLKHAVAHGLIDITTMTDVTKKRVLQLDKDGKTIREWESLSAAGRELGLQVSNISHCISGRIKQTGGYKWKLSEL